MDRGDGFDNRSGSARDARVRAVRSSQQMVFDNFELMDNIGKSLTSQQDKIYFGEVNKATKQTEYRNEEFRKKIRESYRKDGIGLQMKPHMFTVMSPLDHVDQPEGWGEWGTDYKPNEIESRVKLAKHIAPRVAGPDPRPDPEAYIFPKGIDEFMDGPGIYK